MKLISIAAALSSVALAGCMSEVDKCVEAQVVAWKDRNKKNEEILESKKNSEGKLKLSDVIELLPQELETEVIAEARLSCLSANNKR